MNAPSDPPKTGGDETQGASGPPPVNWGIAADLGMRLGVSILIGLVIGLLADNWLKTNGLLILAGLLLGAAAAMYTIWDVARDAMRR